MYSSFRVVSCWAIRNRNSNQARLPFVIIRLRSHLLLLCTLMNDQYRLRYWSTRQVLL